MGGFELGLVQETCGPDQPWNYVDFLWFIFHVLHFILIIYTHMWLALANLWQMSCWNRTFIDLLTNIWVIIDVSGKFQNNIGDWYHPLNLLNIVISSYNFVVHHMWHPISFYQIMCLWHCSCVFALWFYYSSHNVCKIKDCPNSHNNLNIT